MPAPEIQKYVFTETRNGPPRSGVRLTPAVEDLPLVHASVMHAGRRASYGRQARYSFYGRWWLS